MSKKIPTKINVISNKEGLSIIRDFSDHELKNGAVLNQETINLLSDINLLSEENSVEIIAEILQKNLIRDKQLLDNVIDRIKLNSEKKNINSIIKIFEEEVNKKNNENNKLKIPQKITIQ